MNKTYKNLNYSLNDITQIITTSDIDLEKNRYIKNYTKIKKTLDPSIPNRTLASAIFTQLNPPKNLIRTLLKIEKMTDEYTNAFITTFNSNIPHSAQELINAMTFIYQNTPNNNTNATNKEEIKYYETSIKKLVSSQDISINTDILNTFLSSFKLEIEKKESNQYNFDFCI